MYKQTVTVNLSKKSQKFCKVCYDAGKPVAKYSSHYVRDGIGGKVICPTILNQECNYCKKIGHTPSQCPALENRYNKNYKKKDQAEQQSQAQQSQAQQSQAEQKKKSLQFRSAQLCESPPPSRKNVFNALDYEKFPTIIGQNEIRPVPIKLNRWVQEKPKEQKQAEQKQAEQKQAEQKQAEQQDNYIPKDYSNCSWTDVE